MNFFKPFIAGLLFGLVIFSWGFGIYGFVKDSYYPSLYNVPEDIFDYINSTLDLKGLNKISFLNYTEYELHKKVNSSTGGFYDIITRSIYVNIDNLFLEDYDFVLLHEVGHFV